MFFDDAQQAGYSLKAFITGGAGFIGSNLTIVRFKMVMGSGSMIISQQDS